MGGGNEQDLMASRQKEIGEFITSTSRGSRCLAQDSSPFWKILCSVELGVHIGNELGKKEEPPSLLDDVYCNARVARQHF